MLLLAGLVCAVGAVLLRLFGDGASRWTFAALPFTPYALAGAGVLALLGFATRRWGIGAVACLVAVVLAVSVLPRAVADAQPQGRGQTLTVAGANLLYGQGDARTIVEMVRTHRVDVLSLQELTPEAVAALGSAGLWQLLPHRILRPEPRSAGTGLASRYPLQERDSTQPSYHWQIAALVDLPGSPDAEVVAVHSPAPVGRVQPARWRTEIAALPGPLPGTTTRILAGDFNATLDHRPLRALLDTGYRDAAATVGEGLRGTWPADAPVAPIAAIDHVLVQPTCTVLSFDTVSIPGSDHRAVVAELALPAPAAARN